MRVLMALSQLELTGAEVYAVDIGNSLGDLGHDIIYASDTLTKKPKGRYIKFNFTKRSILHRIINIIALIILIKREKIDVVHAHSRASAWICHIVCKILKVPMVHTVHGRQPVHKSSKKFFPSGDKILAVAENIKKNLVEELGVSEEIVEVLRNGIDLKTYSLPKIKDKKNSKEISLIGRLSGPKGDIAYELMEKVFEYDKYKVKMIGGKNIPEKFDKFKNKVNFVGYVDDIAKETEDSLVIIGAGRVALESILMGKETVAIGEAKSIGLIDENNVHEAMESNFGDIGISLKESFQWENIQKDIIRALDNPKDNNFVREKIIENYSLEKITKEIEAIYSQLIKKKRGEK